MAADRIGFIGLGNMGAPMAHRLAAAGFRLVVHDKSGERLRAFREGHPECQAADDLPALGRACHLVITILPDGNIVREVLLGESGVAAGLKPASLVIDMSSASAIGTRETAARLAERGIGFIDAPVSGGVKKAVDGTLAIMAGGDAGTIDRVRPILEVLGKVFLTGPVGSGHAMKSLNNYLSAASLASAAEAILAGRAFGLDPARMIEILNASSGRSNSTENKFPNFILNQAYNSGFGIGLLAKDLRLAREVAVAAGTPDTLLCICAEVWQEAAHELGDLADHTEVFKYLESMGRLDSRGRTGNGA
ncbi:MAG: NAD(P)-dependent oxidoreductase [Gammaproteobacteria bacterium]|nr:MAG: NAD(P)-dependent oxidoreductase [Gammaproteobacteria bacterium]